MRFSLVTFCFIIAALNTAISPARGCYAFAMEESYFYDEQDLATGVDAPAIVEVTILQLSATASNQGVALARVERRIKGPVDGSVIAVAAAPSSCNRGFRVGATGIIVGGLRRNAEGMFEIVAISERLEERWERRALQSGRRQ
jgi:hypothetical protein